jgi:hypothetical protein
MLSLTGAAVPEPSTLILAGTAAVFGTALERGTQAPGSTTASAAAPARLDAVFMRQSSCPPDQPNGPGREGDDNQLFPGIGIAGASEPGSGPIIIPRPAVPNRPRLGAPI